MLHIPRQYQQQFMLPVQCHTVRHSTSGFSLWRESTAPRLTLTLKLTRGTPDSDPPDSRENPFGSLLFHRNADVARVVPGGEIEVCQEHPEYQYSEEDQVQGRQRLEHLEQSSKPRLALRSYRQPVGLSEVWQDLLRLLAINGFGFGGPSKVR